jgi:phosphoglycolate phosphatase-like HAD superfamily hydrolase
MSFSSPFIGQVAFQPSFRTHLCVSHVVFDFDGTLSWLRHGWPEMMVEVMREQLPVLPHETADSIHDLLLQRILHLNGKPTIFQMLDFVSLVQERGGPFLNAENLRAEYQHRLDAAITARSAQICRGEKSPDDFVVYGARKLLNYLRAAGYQLYILSSTVEERVREEAELLKLTDYFEPHIHGGRGDPTQFSKRQVFERILSEAGVSGAQLVSFGDGPVEIRDTKELGGVSIAVCSDENVHGSGEYDPFKKQQLIAAGADVAIPDFQDAITLIQQLAGQSL